jgi:hypothetical protein
VVLIITSDRAIEYDLAPKYIVSIAENIFKIERNREKIEHSHQPNT